MRGLLSRRFVKRLRGETGANLIEAAMMFPLLFLLTFAIVDFSLIFHGYLALENGVTQATRFAVTGNQLSDPGNPGLFLSREDSIKQTMRDATPTLTITDSMFSFSHLPPGASNWIPGPGGPKDVERVTVQYTWTPFSPMVKAFFTNGQLTLKVDSTMKNEAKFE